MPMLLPSGSVSCAPIDAPLSSLLLLAPFPPQPSGPAELPNREHTTITPAPTVDLIMVVFLPAALDDRAIEPPRRNRILHGPRHSHEHAIHDWHRWTPCPLSMRPTHLQCAVMCH